jgi:hypothetical protein
MNGEKNFKNWKPKMIKYCTYIKIFCEEITIIVPWGKKTK